MVGGGRPGGCAEGLRGRKRLAVGAHQKKDEGRAGDRHASPSGDFEERRKDDQESDASRDEREPLPGPRDRVIRSAAYEEHDADEYDGAFQGREERDHSEERSSAIEEEGAHQEPETGEHVDPGRGRKFSRRQPRPEDARVLLRGPDQEHQDRKSTRLNSSHLVISYAVFCLKKKTR